jgi:hypothetical protein
MELSRKLHVSAGLSAGVQPRRCPSAVSPVDGIRQRISYSISVHIEIVSDRMICNSRLANETLWIPHLRLLCLRCARVMLVVSDLASVLPEYC